MSLAMRRRFVVGDTNAAMVMMPVSVKSLHTSAIRRMFSFLSSSEKPRFEFSPVRMLSPSRMRQR